MANEVKKSKKSFEDSFSTLFSSALAVIVIGAEKQMPTTKINAKIEHKTFFILVFLSLNMLIYINTKISMASVASY